MPNEKSPEHRPASAEPEPETETLIVHGLTSSNDKTTTTTTNGQSIFSIDDLLNETSESISTFVLPAMTSSSTSVLSTQMSSKFEEPKTSRVRGLDELNLVSVVEILLLIVGFLDL